MTNEDKIEFGRVLTETAEVYREPITPLRIRLYFEVFKDYDLESVKGAFNSHINNSEFFPKPANIVKIIKGPENPFADIPRVEDIPQWDASKWKPPQHD